MQVTKLWTILLREAYLKLSLFNFNCYFNNKVKFIIILDSAYQISVCGKLHPTNQTSQCNKKWNSVSLRVYPHPFSNAFCSESRRSFTDSDGGALKWCSSGWKSLSLSQTSFEIQWNKKNKCMQKSWNSLKVSSNLCSVYSPNPSSCIVFSI